MKKITLLIFLVITSFTFSQNWTTSTIDLVPGTFTVKFDINITTVQVTLVAPNNVGFAVSPTNDSYGGSGGMGQFGGDDVIFYANGAITDRQQSGGFMQPILDDTQNNWAIVSDDNNIPSVGSRTVVATRARNTGDSNDFIIQRQLVHLQLFGQEAVMLILLFIKVVQLIEVVQLLIQY